MHSATFRMRLQYWVGLKSVAATGLVRRLSGESDREYYEADNNIW